MISGQIVLANDFLLQLITAKVPIAFREICEVLKWKEPKGAVECKGDVPVSEEHTHSGLQSRTSHQELTRM